MDTNTMSSDDRVAGVVSPWASTGAVNDTDLLKVLWANSPAAIPFQPDAVQLLIVDLQKEFRNPPSTNIVLQPTDFDPGSIKTVADLKTAVRQMP